ncbi:MAG: arginine--tRNA ligase [Flavobacteriaceae bacterium]|jgi:arginyl-tRNA synthetase|nr:arginine--tRNA ligase [Flavobacteriaceae bacterium]MDG1774803.1 arginine--tRNA ligase [Flavobacteriaceae bacterium]MDG2416088.1 arginine--tRNA ligase [Flavobacteriaceae bacterium]
MNVVSLIEKTVLNGVEKIFDKSLSSVEFVPTRKDFEGDITVVVFSLLKVIKGNPEVIGNQIGTYLQEELEVVKSFNVVKGFLNISLTDRFFLSAFADALLDTSYGTVKEKDPQAVMVEYSSPNTNKPLHLGHIRNNLLGYSVAQILEASGKKVYKTQIINDRGIHICKSMLAWQKFGHGETPESSGLKGDALVGKYYVAFDKAYKEEVAALVASGMEQATAEKETSLLKAAQEMLIRWESGDDEVVALWKKMNAWVYKGFEETYKRLGVSFDSYYYESDTYLLGKDVVAKGLEQGVFFKKEDGSVWIDLTEEGLDEKIVLRSDGTAVYMTQDIGTAIQRVADYPDVNGMVYTVGNEQDYHFKVLFLILKKLGFSWAQQLFHLSYGMVDLPSGKMKSREGTVVDADDLITEMAATAESISEDLGKLSGYTQEQKASLYHTIGLGALKYYILKVDPKKRILFDPKESVDFQGNTGPFMQYTYARIQSILRKADFETTVVPAFEGQESFLHEKEVALLKQLFLFPETIQLAAQNYSPALVANYTYDLVKAFNSFYQNVSILGESDEELKVFRVALSRKVAQVIQDALGLLGIEVPERM